MQLQSKWKQTSNKFDVSVPVSHAQLQIGSREGGRFWGPEQGSRVWDESCAPSILPGTLHSLFSPPPPSLSPREEALGPRVMQYWQLASPLLGNQLSEQQINLQSKLLPGPSTILGASSSAEVWISGLVFLPAFLG